MTFGDTHLISGRHIFATILSFLWAESQLHNAMASEEDAGGAVVTCVLFWTREQICILMTGLAVSALDSCLRVLSVVAFSLSSRVLLVPLPTAVPFSDSAVHSVQVSL